MGWSRFQSVQNMMLETYDIKDDYLSSKLTLGQDQQQYREDGPGCRQTELYDWCHQNETLRSYPSLNQSSKCFQLTSPQLHLLETSDLLRMKKSARALRKKDSYNGMLTRYDSLNSSSIQFSPTDASIKDLRPVEVSGITVRIKSNSKTSWKQSCKILQEEFSESENVPGR